jgi:hypothetical protein
MFALFMLISQAFAADPAEDVIIKPPKPITVWAYQYSSPDVPTTTLTSCTPVRLEVEAQGYDQLAYITTGDGVDDAHFVKVFNGQFTIDQLNIIEPFGPDMIIFAAARQLEDMPKFLAWVKSGREPKEFVWSDFEDMRGGSKEPTFQTAQARMGLTRKGYPVYFYVFKFFTKRCPRSVK